MSKTSKNREAALTALAEHYDIPVLDENEARCAASTEDLWEYLHGEYHIDRWVSVTYHDGENGGTHYVKTFTTRTAAENYTVQYVSDDIFAEAPIAVVDLDDPIEPHGKVYRLLQLIPVYEGSEP